MNQVVILCSYKDLNKILKNYTIIRLGKMLSRHPFLNCTIASVDDFSLTDNMVFVTRGAILEGEELKIKSFTIPFTPDYVFSFQTSEDPDFDPSYFKLLKDIAVRGVTISNDSDAALMGVKSVLEERCCEFESISGLQITRPKTILVKGNDDRSKIIDFIKRSGPCILKPHNSSRARGMRILVSEDQVPQLILNNDRYVLQELVSNPMTVNGYKIGLRIYLSMYDLKRPRYAISEQGLVKLAVQPYMRGNPESEIVGSSYSKRLGFNPVMYLLKDLINSNEDATYHWKDVRKSIEKTLEPFMEAIAWRAAMHHEIDPSFQFWGIDMAIQNTNEGPKAYLIEVNPFPALYRNDEITDNALDLVLAEELFAKAVSVYAGKVA